MTIFETERLTLRHLKDDDFEDLHAICSDPELMKYVGEGRVLSEEETRRWIKKSQENYQTYGYGCSAIINKSDQRFIGYCGLVYAPQSTEVEIIYALNAQYQRRGLATEASTAMIKYGFEECGLKQILAIVHVNNHASRRVIEKIGQSYQREERENDCWPDLVFVFKPPKREF